MSLETEIEKGIKLISADKEGQFVFEVIDPNRIFETVKRLQINDTVLEVKSYKDGVAYISYKNPNYTHQGNRYLRLGRGKK